MALTATLTTGCGTFADNDVAAKAEGHELSIDDLVLLSKDFGLLAETGEFAGTDLRGILSQWVVTTALADRFGLGKDAAANEEAAKIYTDDDPVRWAALSPVTQELLIGGVLTQQYLTANPDVISDDVLAAAYNAGVTASQTLCLRVIVSDDVLVISDVATQLEAGGDFAELAAANSTDAGSAANGGILANADGNECVPASGISESIVTALTTTPIGVPSAPTPLGSSYVILLQRPYAEVAEQARTALGTSQAVASRVIGTDGVSIDSRYGMWDAATGAVVPTR